MPLYASSGVWMEVTDGPDAAASGESRVMPVFPAPTILWPENTVEFCVVEPAHRQLYEDLLMSGARHIVAPFARMMLKPQRSCMMHSTAPVLRLEELKDMSEKTDGKMKYMAKHAVVGRASIKRLLNPSALFETNGDGLRRDYLRVEAKVFPDEERSIPGSVDLARHWRDLALLSERLGEPRMGNVSAKEVTTASTWQLAALWYKLQVGRATHRQEALVADAVNSWIQKEKEQGRVRGSASDALDSLPAPLLKQIKQLKGPLGPQLDLSFYEPFLALLGADSPQRRSVLLEGMALDEVKLARARASVRDLFH
jgi:hypothetical protein